MSDKLFHVTNDDTLLSGVYFDPKFSTKREAWRKVRAGGKKSFKIDREAKEALEISIERGKTVTVDATNHAFSAQNTEDGTMYPKDHIWEI